MFYLISYGGLYHFGDSTVAVFQPNATKIAGAQVAFPLKTNPVSSELDKWVQFYRLLNKVLTGILLSKKEGGE